MEEEKAAAYYDELTRKGEGAARYKQGLGFTSASNDAAPSRGSALSSSSFLSAFVKASSPSKAAELQKEAQLESIQNKLKKKSNEVPLQTQSSSRVSRDRDRVDRRSSRRSRSRDRHSRHRSRSLDSGRRSSRRSRSRSRDRDRHSRRHNRSRSRSRSRDDYLRRSGRRSRSRDRERERERERERRSRRRRSSSESPSQRKSDKSNTSNGIKVEKDKNGKVDCGKLIEGYDKMTPADRVKAKMKLQLSETVQKDEANMGSGWERFDFDKDAPLDDEEIEAAEDDAVLVKHIGQSFRFSAVEARREDELKAAHDEAIFGAPSLQPSAEMGEEEEETERETSESAPATSLISDQVLTMQQGSWRDRIRKT